MELTLEEQLKKIISGVDALTLPTLPDANNYEDDFYKYTFAVNLNDVPIKDRYKAEVTLPKPLTLVYIKKENSWPYPNNERYYWKLIKFD